MVGGMGGLGKDLTGLIEAQDLTDMRNPQSIVGNMNQNRVKMGSGMQRAVQAQGIDPGYQPQQQQMIMSGQGSNQQI